MDSETEEFRFVGHIAFPDHYQSDLYLVIPENTNTWLETISWHDSKRNLKIDEPVNKGTTILTKGGDPYHHDEFAFLLKRASGRISKIRVIKMPFPVSETHGDKWMGKLHQAQLGRKMQSRQEVWIQNCGLGTRGYCPYWGSLEWVVEKRADKFHWLPETTHSSRDCSLSHSTLPLCVSFLSWWHVQTHKLPFFSLKWTSQ